MKTHATKLSEIKREWWGIDANNKVLGRMVSKIAEALMGKHKVYFTSHLDCGDYVVVTNIDKVTITGKKASQKIYYAYSGYPGGLRDTTFSDLMKKDPKKVIMHAIKGMLPDNKLRPRMMKRLKLFVGNEHTYQDKALKEMTV